QSLRIFFPSANGDRRLCRCKCARPNFYSRMRSELIAWLAQDRIRCRKHRFIVVIRQSGQEMANPATGLPKKQFGSELVRSRRISISLRKLELGILTTEHAG